MTADASPQEELERERALLFRRFPLVVAHASELAEPGDFVTIEVTGIPLLLTRADGGLRAFVNVCRHRATRVETAAGGCDKKCFVCPLHGWRYDLEGKLADVPEEFSRFERDKLDLVPVPIAEAFGLIWVSLTRGGPLHPRAFAAGIADDLDTLDLGALGVAKKHALTRPADWKSTLETLFDCDGSASIEARGLHLRYKSSVAKGGFIVVFPNTLIEIGEAGVRILSAAPTVPGSARFTYWSLTHGGKQPEPIDESTQRRSDPAAAEAFRRALASVLEPSTPETR
jgi:nitrite reductase/ring-hydroxylating ferredoxin subunit